MTLQLNRPYSVHETPDYMDVISPSMGAHADFAKVFYQIFYVFSEGRWLIERMDAFDGFDYHFNEQEVELAEHEIDQGINVEKNKRFVADERKE